VIEEADQRRSHRDKLSQGRVIVAL
jgi:hypothetical protein